MKEYFYRLSDACFQLLDSSEILTLSVNGEVSDFCRFNHGKVRQMGNVQQAYLGIHLIEGMRAASFAIVLTHIFDEDLSAVKEALTSLRQQIKVVPEDPHLLYSMKVTSSEYHGEKNHIQTHKIVQEVCDQARDLDFVGIFMGGELYSGYSDSFGQKNWYDTNSFNLDWSIFAQDDRAFKDRYAGFHWDPSVFEKKLETGRKSVPLLKQDPYKIKPGKYKVYLAPNAVAEILELLNWGGFSLKAHETHFSPLSKMSRNEMTLNPLITIYDRIDEGISPNFSPEGFMRPDNITLIESGKIKDYAISPRSAKEFNKPTNGAKNGEQADSLDLAPGTLDTSNIYETIGDGIYISDLHYLNFSDRLNARITGMTRFATFYIENGKIKAPLSVMRFDDSLYSIWGDELQGLSSEREFVFSSNTYFQRSRASLHVPGALIDNFTFTL